MSKTFKAAPKPKQPTAQEIAAFESGGLGHDTKPTKVENHNPANVGKMGNVSKEATNAEPMKRLSLDVPQSTHTRFKTACSATNRKMVREIADFIERRTAELEAEAGISR